MVSLDLFAHRHWQIGRLDKRSIGLNAGVASVSRSGAACFSLGTKPDHGGPDKEHDGDCQKAFAVCHDKRVRLNQSLKHSVGLLQRPNWISRVVEVVYGLVR